MRAVYPLYSTSKRAKAGAFTRLLFSLFVSHLCLTLAEARQYQACNYAGQCPSRWPHCCNGKCVCDSGCDQEFSRACKLRKECDDQKDHCTARGEESSRDVSKQHEYQCKGSCSTCPAVRAVSSWMSARGKSFPERVLTFWSLDPTEALPRTCECNTHKVQYPWQCDAKHICTGPCENTGFGEIVSFNEGLRSEFTAWGPIFILIFIFFFWCNDWHYRSQFRKQEQKLEELEKLLQSNLKSRKSE
jgi:hypothetical protein